MNPIQISWGYAPGSLSHGMIYAGQTYRQTLASLGIKLEYNSVVTANGVQRNPESIVTNDINTILVSKPIKGNA